MNDLSNGRVGTGGESPESCSHGVTIRYAIRSDITSLEARDATDVRTVLGRGDVGVEFALSAGAEHEPGGEATFVMIPPGASRGDGVADTTVC